MAVYCDVKRKSIYTRRCSWSWRYARLALPLPYVALRIQYNGPPGSLTGQVSTVEENTGKVELMGLRNEGDGYAASLASYWSFDEKTDFYIFYTNMSEKIGCVGIRVDAGGVQYFVPVVKLNPHETIHVNIRELRDKQQPDVKGHTIPPDVTEGRLFYNRLDNVPMMGCVMELPRHQ